MFWLGGRPTFGLLAIRGISATFLSVAIHDFLSLWRILKVLRANLTADFPLRLPSDHPEHADAAAAPAAWRLGRGAARLRGRPGGAPAVPGGRPPGLRGGLEAGGREAVAAAVAVPPPVFSCSDAEEYMRIACTFFVRLMLQVGI
jgi:hypothetical protein